MIHKENCGAGEARNLGIDLAVGKYIIFLDGDDYWVPDILKCLWNEAEKYNLHLLLFSGVCAYRVKCIGDHLYKRRYRQHSVMTGKTIFDSARRYGRAVESVIARM